MFLLVVTQVDWGCFDARSQMVRALLKHLDVMRWPSAAHDVTMSATFNVGSRTAVESAAMNCLHFV